VPVPNVQWITPDDGQRNCPKHVDFRTGINLEICASVGFIVKELGKIRYYIPGRVRIDQAASFLASDGKIDKHTFSPSFKYYLQ